MEEKQFIDIIKLIKSAKEKTLLQVNASLIELYWNIGTYVHQKVVSNEWGKSIVSELSKHIQKVEPGIQGFSDRNIWRMKQFYETYTNEEFLKLSALPTVLKTIEIQADRILSALLTELSWSAHLEIISGCKTPDERLFYLINSKTERWSYRELKRQIESSTYERVMIGKFF